VNNNEVGRLSDSITIGHFEKEKLDKVLTGGVLKNVLYREAPP